MLSNRFAQQKSFSLPKFLAWKTRDISQACFQLIINSYFLLYCTNILHINSALVGTLLMLSKCLDIIADLAAGAIVDSTHTKLGQGRPYELCIVGAWSGVILLFFCNAEWPIPVKAIWIFVCYSFTFSVFTTFLNASQTPYIIHAFRSRDAVSKVSSYGAILSTLGAIFVAVTFPLFLDRIGDTARGWHTLILIYAIPLTLFGLVRFFFVNENCISTENYTSKAAAIRLSDVKKLFLTNRFLWIYAAINALFSFTTGLSITTLYFKYIVGDLSLQGILSIATFFLLPIMFLFPKIMKRMGVAQLIGCTSIIASIGYILNWFAGKNLYFLIFGGMLTSLATLPLSYLSPLINYNLSLYNQAKGLPSMEATTSAIGSMTTKIFNALGVGATGILLSIGQYQSADNVIQPESAILTIRIIFSLIPLACMILISLLSINFSKLDKILNQRKL